MAIRWRYMLSILLLFSSVALYGCGSNATVSNPIPVLKAPAATREARHTVWVQPAKERFTPEASWLLLSADEVAKRGAVGKLPLFAGEHVRRMMPQYAMSVLHETQKISRWDASGQVTYRSDDFKIVDAWEGLLGGKSFVLDMYESTKGSKLFLMAEAYNHRVVDATAFEKPVYWMAFTGRYVAFVVPYPTTGFYGALDLTTGERIIQNEMARKMANMWEVTGGQPGNVYGLTKDGYGWGPSCSIPSVNYEPYIYSH